MASFLAGIPESVPCRTVNRQCSSGLQAIADVAAAIRSGLYPVGIAGGVETMSSNAMVFSGRIPSVVKKHDKASQCLLPMGITSENVAAKFHVSRQEQDALAVKSHQRAARAIEMGRFQDEIVPIRTSIKDKKTGAWQDIVFDTDDGVRANISPAALGKLKPVFRNGGSTTAGNASQVSDGASAALLMTRGMARAKGLPIEGIIRSFAVVGVPPDVMGIGPAFAIPEAVGAAGLGLDDVDLYEINEAFASQACYCVRELGLDWDKVNVNGGAIALGHPLVNTGCRMTATLLSEMKKRGDRFGVVSMCIGTGMGAAAVFERE
jgi:acetyl-CoA acyltransferase 1